MKSFINCTSHEGKLFSHQKSLFTSVLTAAGKLSVCITQTILELCPEKVVRHAGMTRLVSALSKTIVSGYYQNKIG